MLLNLLTKEQSRMISWLCYRAKYHSFWSLRQNLEQHEAWCISTQSKLILPSKPQWPSSVSSWVRYHGLCPPESPKEQHARAHFPSDDRCIRLLANFPWRLLSAKCWSKFLSNVGLKIASSCNFDIRWSTTVDLDGFGVYKSTIVYPDVYPIKMALFSPGSIGHPLRLQWGPRPGLCYSSAACHIPVPSALMVSHMVSLVIPIDEAEGIISGNQ